MQRVCFYVFWPQGFFTCVTTLLQEKNFVVVVVFQEKKLLNWPLKSEKISFIKPLGVLKIKQIVSAAIDDKFVNSREGGESRERSEEETKKGFRTRCFLG